MEKIYYHWENRVKPLVVAAESAEDIETIATALAPMEGVILFFFDGTAVTGNVWNPMTKQLEEVTVLLTDEDVEKLRDPMWAHTVLPKEPGGTV